MKTIYIYDSTSIDIKDTNYYSYPADSLLDNYDIAYKFYIYTDINYTPADIEIIDENNYMNYYIKNAYGNYIAASGGYDSSLTYYEETKWEELTDTNISSDSVIKIVINFVEKKSGFTTKPFVDYCNFIFKTTPFSDEEEELLVLNTNTIIFEGAPHVINLLDYINFSNFDDAYTYGCSFFLCDEDGNGLTEEEIPNKVLYTDIFGDINDESTYINRKIRCKFYKIFNSIKSDYCIKDFDIKFIYNSFKDYYKFQKDTSESNPSIVEVKYEDDFILLEQPFEKNYSIYGGTANSATYDNLYIENNGIYFSQSGISYDEANQYFCYTNQYIKNKAKISDTDLAWRDLIDNCYYVDENGKYKILSYNNGDTFYFEDGTTKFDITNYYYLSQYKKVENSDEYDSKKQYYLKDEWNNTYEEINLVENNSLFIYDEDNDKYENITLPEIKNKNSKYITDDNLITNDLVNSKDYYVFNKALDSDYYVKINDEYYSLDYEDSYEYAYQTDSGYYQDLTVINKNNQNLYYIYDEEKGYLSAQDNEDMLKDYYEISSIIYYHEVENQDEITEDNFDKYYIQAIYYDPVDPSINIEENDIIFGDTTYYYFDENNGIYVEMQNYTDDYENYYYYNDENNIYLKNNATDIQSFKYNTNIDYYGFELVNSENIDVENFNNYKYYIMSDSDLSMSLYNGEYSDDIEYYEIKNITQYIANNYNLDQLYTQSIDYIFPTAYDAEKTYYYYNEDAEIVYSKINSINEEKYRSTENDINYYKLIDNTYYPMFYDNTSDLTYYIKQIYGYDPSLNDSYSNFNTQNGQLALPELYEKEYITLKEYFEKNYDDIYSKYYYRDINKVKETYIQAFPNRESLIEYNLNSISYEYVEVDDISDYEEQDYYELEDASEGYKQLFINSDNYSTLLNDGNQKYKKNKIEEEIEYYIFQSVDDISDYEEQTYYIPSDNNSFIAISITEKNYGTILSTYNNFYKKVKSEINLPDLTYYYKPIYTEVNDINNVQLIDGVIVNSDEYIEVYDITQWENTDYYIYNINRRIYEKININSDNYESYSNKLDKNEIEIYCKKELEKKYNYVYFSKAEGNFDSEKNYYVYNADNDTYSKTAVESNNNYNELKENLYVLSSSYIKASGEYDTSLQYYENNNSAFSKIDSVNKTNFQNYYIKYGADYTIPSSYNEDIEYYEYDEINSIYTVVVSKANYTDYYILNGDLKEKYEDINNKKYYYVEYITPTGEYDQDLQYYSYDENTKIYTEIDNVREDNALNYYQKDSEENYKQAKGYGSDGLYYTKKTYADSEEIDYELIVSAANYMNYKILGDYKPVNNFYSEGYFYSSYDNNTNPDESSHYFYIPQFDKIIPYKGDTIINDYIPYNGYYYAKTSYGNYIYDVNEEIINEYKYEEGNKYYNYDQVNKIYYYNSAVSSTDYLSYVSVNFETATKYDNSLSYYVKDENENYYFSKIVTENNYTNFYLNINGNYLYPEGDYSEDSIYYWIDANGDYKKAVDKNNYNEFFIIKQDYVTPKKYNEFEIYYDNNYDILELPNNNNYENFLRKAFVTATTYNSERKYYNYDNKYVTINSVTENNYKNYYTFDGESYIKVLDDDEYNSKITYYNLVKIYKPINVVDSNNYEQYYIYNNGSYVTDSAYHSENIYYYKKNDYQQIVDGTNYINYYIKGIYKIPETYNSDDIYYSLESDGTYKQTEKANENNYKAYYIKDEEEYSSAIILPEYDGSLTYYSVSIYSYTDDQGEEIINTDYKKEISVNNSNYSNYYIINGTYDILDGNDYTKATEYSTTTQYYQLVEKYTTAVNSDNIGNYFEKSDNEYEEATYYNQDEIYYWSEGNEAKIDENNYKEYKIINKKYRCNKMPAYVLEGGPYTLYENNESDFKQIEENFVTNKLIAYENDEGYDQISFEANIASNEDEEIPELYLLNEYKVANNIDEELLNNNYYYTKIQNNDNDNITDFASEYVQTTVLLGYIKNSDGSFSAVSSLSDDETEYYNCKQLEVNDFINKDKMTLYYTKEDEYYKQAEYYSSDVQYYEKTDNGIYNPVELTIIGSSNFYKYYIKQKGELVKISDLQLYTLQKVYAPKVNISKYLYLNGYKSNYLNLPHNDQYTIKYYINGNECFLNKYGGLDIQNFCKTDSNNNEILTKNKLIINILNNDEIIHTTECYFDFTIMPLNSQQYLEAYLSEQIQE